jgi:hypothetical protein
LTIAPTTASWTASSNAPWLTLASGSAGGTGNATVTYQFADNLATTPRTGQLTIGGQTFTVNQASGVATFTPTTANVGANAGSATVALSMTPAAASWSATSNAAWLTLASGSAAGSGSATLTYQFTANTGTTSRTGQISVGGQSFGVTQAGASLGLGATEASVGAAAGSGTVALAISPPTLSWTATSNVPWLTLAPGSSAGTGSATVGYQFTANSGGAYRAGTLTIAGIPFVVTQANPICVFTVTPTTLSLGAGELPSGQLTVTPSNSLCTWTATSSASWLRLTGATTGVGAGTVPYAVSANTGTTTRTATIEVNGQRFVVTQNGVAPCTSYALSQTTVGVGSAASNNAITVTTAGTCGWTATSSVGWITFPQGAAGAGTGALAFTVAANPANTARTGVVTVAGLTLVITQAAANNPRGCVVTAAPAPVVAAEGVTELLGSLTVTCTGFATAVTGSLELTLNTPVTNRVTGETVNASLAINGGAPAVGTLGGYGTLRWRGVTLNPGSTTLTVSGVRANASLLPLLGQESTPITAAVQFVAESAVPVNGGVQTIGLARPTISFQRGAPRPGSPVLVPFYFREAFAAGLRAGSRFRLAVPGLPAGAVVSASVFPLEGATRARLVSANPAGEGGNPVAGSTLAGGIYQTLVATGGTVTATWEVLGGNDQALEDLTVTLAFEGVPEEQVRALLTTIPGSLAPVSRVETASATAAVPRYRDLGENSVRASLRLSMVLRRANGSLVVPSSKTQQRELFNVGEVIRAELKIENDGAVPSTGTVVQGSYITGLLLGPCSPACTTTANGSVYAVGTIAPGGTWTGTSSFTVTAPSGPEAVATVFGSVAGDQPPENVVTTATYVSAPINRVEVVQCGYGFDPGGSVPVAWQAGNRNVTLTATGGCPWTATATSTGSWLSVSPAGGTGSGTLVVSYSANPTTVAREGTIDVNGTKVTIVQAGGLPPSVAATAPVAGSGSSKTFTLRFSHPGGFQNLGVLNVLINKALDGGRACYLAYSQPAGVLFVVKDAGPDAGLSEPLVLGSTGNVSNSQCQVNGVGSSAVGSGNVLTLTLNITFRPAFAGNHVVYLAARDQVGPGNSGWSTLGFHEVPGAPVTYPNAINMSPAAGTTSSSTVTFAYEDQSNSANIQTAWALVNTALNGASACYVAYFAPGNILFLFPDDGSAAGLTNMVLAGTASLENSQCRINAQGSSVVRSGGRLTLNLNMTFKPGFAGSKAVWLALQTVSAVTSPWKVGGAWQVPP